MNIFAGNHHLQDILVEYLETESPQPGQPYFYEEFSNLMHLFVELLRAGVFSHDLYVKSLITTGEMMESLPIVPRIRARNSDKTKVNLLQKLYKLRKKILFEESAILYAL